MTLESRLLPGRETRHPLLERARAGRSDTEQCHACSSHYYLKLFGSVIPSNGHVSDHVYYGRVDSFGRIIPYV